MKMNFPIPAGWKPVRFRMTKKMKEEAQRDWDMMRKAIREFHKKTGLPDNWRGRIINST